MCYRGSKAAVYQRERGRSDVLEMGPEGRTSLGCESSSHRRPKARNCLGLQARKVCHVFEGFSGQGPRTQHKQKGAELLGKELLQALQPVPPAQVTDCLCIRGFPAPRGEEGKKVLDINVSAGIMANLADLVEYVP